MSWRVAKASARHATNEPSGKVISGLPHRASNALILLRGVQEHLPAIELELTEELTGNLSRWIKSGLAQVSCRMEVTRVDLCDACCQPWPRQHHW